MTDISGDATRPSRAVRPREGWGGCLAAVLSLLGVALCVGLGLALVAGRHVPQALDRYLSLEPGQASLYRITYANGAAGFYSVNTVRPGTDSLAYAALLGQGGEAVQTHVIATNWQGQPGQLYSRDEFSVRGGQSLRLLAQREAGTTTEFTPPLPAWDPRLLETDRAHPLTGQVAFRDTTFDYSLWLDGRETIRLPDGRETEAVRLALELAQGGALAYRSLSWHAAGVGQVRAEEYDGDGRLLTRTELLASTRLAGGPAALPLDELLAEAGGGLGLFREDAARTGAHPAARLPAGPLQPAYRLTLEAAFTASPVLADGLLIAADQSGMLFALDAEQAALRWQFGVGGGVVAAPAVAHGLVYAGASDRTLYALTAREGLFVWSFRLHDNIATSPVAAGGVLFVGGEDRTLYALDALTGAERWRFLAGDRIVSSPAAADGRVFFGSDDGLLYALEAATGRELWRSALDAPIQAAPAVAGGVVYAGSTETQFAAVAAASGERLWTAESAFGYKASPAVGAQLVYVADQDGVLRALRRVDGTLAWEWRADYGATFVGSPLLLGERLVVVDDEGVLHLFDAAEGRELQRLPLAAGGVSASPTWDGTTLYLTTQDKRVLALRAGEGVFSPALDPAWQFSFGGVEAAPYAAPLAWDGALYAVTSVGDLWRLDARTGAGARVAAWGETVLGAPANAGGQLYVGTQAGTLIAFDLDGHAELWRTALAGAVRFAPAVDAGRVYAHALADTGGVVYALEAATGSVLWQAETGDGGLGTPLRVGDMLIASGNGLLALDPATGAELWRSAPFYSFGAMLAEGEVIYAAGAGAEDETLIALEAATGRRLWQSAEPGTFGFSRPALDPASQTLVAGSYQGQVYGLDADTGATRWRFPADAGVQSDVQVQAGIVYFSTTNGTLYALEARTGRLLANFRPGAVLSYAPPLVTPERVYATNGVTLYALEVAP